MIRAIATLCLLAAPAFGLMLKGLPVRYGLDPSSYGSTEFVNMPQTRDAAISQGWVNTTRPESPAGYESLDMWCSKDNYTFCLLYDDTSNVAGAQIALNTSQFTSKLFDWGVSGFTQWNVTVNGTTYIYYATLQLYMSAEYLALPAETRLAKRNNSVIPQGQIFMTGFNGKLYNVSTNVSELNNTAFTKQGCFPGMGTHYYYNMTTSQVCSAETLLTYFLLVSDGQIVGVGFALPGQYPLRADERDPFEHPNDYIIKINVPKAPQCVYDYVDNPGWITMHVFFVDKAYNITCNTS